MSELPAPESLLGRRPDGVWETSVRKTLQMAPESDRLAFLSTVLVLHEQARITMPIWFRMALSLLHERDSFEHLLTLGLQFADPSSMKYWMQVCCRRIGILRTIRMLEEHETANPRGVAYAEYWLMTSAINNKEVRAVQSFLEQPHRAARRGKPFDEIG